MRKLIKGAGESAKIKHRWPPALQSGLCQMKLHLGSYVTKQNAKKKKIHTQGHHGLYLQSGLCTSQWRRNRMSQRRRWVQCTIFPLQSSWISVFALCFCQLQLPRGMPCSATTPKYTAHVNQMSVFRHVVTMRLMVEGAALSVIKLCSSVEFESKYHLFRSLRPGRG